MSGKTRLTRRDLLVSTGATIGASSFPMPAIAQSPVELSIGILASSSDIGIFLADVKGWFKEEKIIAKTIPFNSGVNMVAPMSAGQLDVGAGVEVLQIAHLEALDEDRCIGVVDGIEIKLLRTQCILLLLCLHIYKRGLETLSSSSCHSLRGSDVGHRLYLS